MPTETGSDVITELDPPVVEQLLSDISEKEISELVISFYNSEKFTQLQRFSDYKNEAEIYLNEKDYYLYGIIDKLIIAGKKIRIVDYKTDDIQAKIIKDIANYYLNQLNFYANIVSKLHKDFEQIEIKIIFLKHPDIPFSMVYRKTDIERIETEITAAIKGILRGDSSKNLLHCKECNFSFKNRCII